MDGLTARGATRLPCPYVREVRDLRETLPPLAGAGVPLVRRRLPAVHPAWSYLVGVSLSGRIAIPSPRHVFALEPLAGAALAPHWGAGAHSPSRNPAICHVTGLASRLHLSV